VVLAGVLILAGCSGDEEPEVAAAPTVAAPAPSPTIDPSCPLSGVDASNLEDLERPALAVKISNTAAAYPLSGLEKAELVYEELIEGGMTRFMAIYHCTDAAKAGPVRSSRAVDPAIMTPATRLLAAAGGNDIVRAILKKNDIVILDEDNSGKAMRRVPRTGISFEHTLYGNTKALRNRGAKDFTEPPPSDLFLFGDLEGKTRKAKTATLRFANATTVTYTWNGKAWERSERGATLTAESGDTIEVDNVIIEEHEVRNSRTIVDVAGNPSIEITDVVGSGRAVLLRDGKAVYGKWVRKTKRGRVVYKTKAGDEMVLAPGNTWVALLPSPQGELKGSFQISKR
jgi:hypothetical protein